MSKHRFLVTGVKSDGGYLVLGTVVAASAVRAFDYYLEHWRHGFYIHCVADLGQVSADAKLGVETSYDLPKFFTPEVLDQDFLMFLTLNLKYNLRVNEFDICYVLDCARCPFNKVTPSDNPIEEDSTKECMRVLQQLMDTLMAMQSELFKNER